MRLSRNRITPASTRSGCAGSSARARTLSSIYAASPQRTARAIACASSVKRASISSSASRLLRKMSRHITGSDAAMRVKSRKPEAANCSTSCRVSPSRSSAVPQMVKAIRCGRWLTIASTRSWWPGSIRSTIEPQRRQSVGDLLHRPGIGARRRRQQAPAALEQLGEPGIRPGIFGARQRVGRHEMHALRHQRPDIADHRLLGGPHIGQDAPRRQMRRDRLRPARIGAHRRAQHDAVGPLDRPRRVELHPIGDAEFAAPGPASPACARWPRPRRRCPPRSRGDARDRAADQPDAEQREPAEQRLSHRAWPRHEGRPAASATSGAFLAGADGDAQAVRQAIAADAAHDDAARRAGTHPPRRRAPRWRNRRGRNCPRWARPSCRPPPAPPTAAPARRCCGRTLRSTQPGSASAATAAAWAARLTLNSPRTRLSTSITAGGP